MSHFLTYKLAAVKSAKDKRSPSIGFAYHFSAAVLSSDQAFCNQTLEGTPIILSIDGNSIISVQTKPQITGGFLIIKRIVQVTCHLTQR